MASAFLGDAALASDAYPDVPEPMIFDMMRPLGAKRGELEVNTLATVPLSGDDDAVHWAPEIEYAFADGFAIEGELPFVNGRLAELKLGLQASFGTTGGGRTGHGVQYLGHRADHHMGLARRAMIEQDDIIQRPDDDRLRPFSTINFFPDHASGTSMAPSCPKAKRVAKCLTHQGKACSATPTGSSRAPTVISARI